MKVKVVTGRACFPIGGVDTWFDRDAEVEVTAEEFAVLENMGYVGGIVVAVEAASKPKKGDTK